MGTKEGNEEDIIKSYLNNKIDEIKFLTTEANEELERRKKHREECIAILKTQQNFGNTELEILNCWQRIYNNKWVVGIRVKNNTGRSAKNIVVILKCDSTNPLNYKTKIYVKNISDKEEVIQIDDDDDMEIDKSVNQPNIEYKPLEGEWIETTELKSEATIVIVMDVPKFLDIKEYKINGMIIFERLGSFQEQIQEIILSVNDVSDNLFVVKTNDIVNCEEEAYITVLVSSITTPVQIKIPEGIYRTLEGLIQLDCFFTRVQISGHVFLYDGVSDILSGAMVKVLNGMDSYLITKDSKQLHFLLHHLYKSIPDVVILTEDYEQIGDPTLTFLSRPTQSFLMDTLPVNQDGVNNFISSFDKQLDLVERTLVNYAEKQDVKNTGKNIVIPSEEYKQWRKTLTDLERETDCLYMNLSENKH